MIYSAATVGDLRYVTNIFNCRDDMYVCFGNFYDKIIIYFLINAVLQILIYLVCYYFSPEVFAISDIISPILSFIKECITEPPPPIQITFNSIGYVIVLLGAFIYNEILVLNFYGLNKYTWKAIDLRADEDLSDENFRDSKLIGDLLLEDE